MYRASDQVKSDATVQATRAIVKTLFLSPNPFPHIPRPKSKRELKKEAKMNAIEAEMLANMARDLESPMQDEEEEYTLDEEDEQPEEDRDPEPTPVIEKKAEKKIVKKSFFGNLLRKIKGKEGKKADMWSSCGRTFETEGQHEDHGAREENILTAEGRRAMGLENFDVYEPRLTEGKREIRIMANEARARAD